MIRMAAPFKDPRTGIYYFRRIVPGALRTHFDGGRTEYKRSLETRDPNEAKDRYPAQAVIYDLKLKSARRAVLNDHIAGARNMVDAFLSGVDDQQLRGHASKLASLEIEAFAYAHGTAGYLAGARYDFGAPPSKPDLGDHADRKRMLEAVPDLQPLPWQETLLRVAALPSLHPIAWAITAIAYNASVEAPPGSELYEAIGQAYLDRLCVACVVTIPPSRMRIVPPTIIVGSAPTDARLSEPEGRSPTTRPGLAIAAVFELWATFTPREPKLVDEWRTAIGRFAALHNDPPVTIITPATRRLQLAASEGGVPVVILRRWRRADSCPLSEPSAAVTRWRIGAAPSVRLGLPGVGRACWHVELVRQRGGESFSLMLEACDGEGRLALPAAARDRAATQERAITCAA